MAVPGVTAGYRGVQTFRLPYLAIPASALILGFLSLSLFWLRNINYYCCEISPISPASRPFRFLPPAIFLSRPLLYGVPHHNPPPETNITYLLDPELSNNYIMYTAIHIVPRVDFIMSKGQKNKKLDTAV